MNRRGQKSLIKKKKEKKSLINRRRAFVCNEAKTNAHFTKEWEELDKTEASDTNVSYQIRYDPTKSWRFTPNNKCQPQRKVKDFWSQSDSHSNHFHENLSINTGGILSKCGSTGLRCHFSSQAKTESSCNESNRDCDLYASDSWENHSHLKLNKAHLILQQLLQIKVFVSSMSVLMSDEKIMNHANILPFPLCNDVMDLANVTWISGGQQLINSPHGSIDVIKVRWADTPSRSLITRIPSA